MKDRYAYWDIDKTLCKGQCFTPKQCLAAKPIPKYLKKIQKDYETKLVMIYTARRNHLIPATLEWFRRHDIRWHWFSNIKVPFVEGHYIDTDSKHPDDL